MGEMKHSGLTQAVGAFISGMRFEDVPADAIKGAINGITDYAGVALYGRDDEVVRVVGSFAGLSGTGEARAVFSDRRTDAANAAFVSGTAGHANDYDDVGLGFHPAHPTVAIAPAVMAEAEVLGASGRDILEAYVTGYEAWGEIASRDVSPQHQKGWHTTGTFGAVAAAAACARLRGLDAGKAANAVGIAASQAGGLVANFGSMTKPFHAGRAGYVGVMSARYAEAGMTASADPIGHKRGFLHAVSPAGEVDLETPARFGKHWWSLARPISLKLYPMCYASHRALEGMFKLAAAHDLKADQVEAITVRMSPTRAISLVNTDPKTGLDAKFSIEFAMAMALIVRRATLTETTDEFLARPDVQTLMRKVRRDLDPATEGKTFADEPDDWIYVDLKDGGRLGQKLAKPNDVAMRVDRQTLWTKFADCAGAAAGAEGARELFDRLQGLDRLSSVGELPVIPWPSSPAKRVVQSDVRLVAGGGR